MITKQWFQVETELDSFVYQGQPRTEAIVSCSSKRIRERFIGPQKLRILVGRGRRDQKSATVAAVETKTSIQESMQKLYNDQ